MLKNYLLIAWRQLLKNKLYAGINITGLVVGLTVYVFGFLLVAYENSHDQFYLNSDRIFTASSHFNPDAGIGVLQADGVYTTVGPLIEADIPQVEAVARTVGREFLVSIDDRQFYEDIKFVDPSFLRIFDFQYIEGDASALERPDGVLMIRTVAEKYFGTAEGVIGETIELDYDTVLYVAAVIEDLPANTHFTSSLIGSVDNFGIFAPLAALNAADDYDLAGNWSNLSTGDMTYMLWPKGTEKAEVQGALDAVWEAHFDENMKEFIPMMEARTLPEANTIIWDAIGLLILESLQVLALLVLVVAIVNYTNLATAQSMGRSREVGLRKTMGAGQGQLLGQFLVESISLVALSMLIAMAVIEVIVPLFNGATDKDLSINYMVVVPWLVATTFVVGVVSGAYPAYLITRATPIDALKNSGNKGNKGGLFRSVMLGVQFTISIFMLAMVIVVYFQNTKVAESANIYPRSQVVLLQRLGLESIQERFETLRSEWLKIDGVENVSFSGQVPYEQSNSSSGYTLEPGDEDSQRTLMQVSIDERFLETYQIPLLAGRDLTNEISNDTIKRDVLAANIIVNELALDRFELGSPEQALGRVLYDTPDSREPRAYTIVGVLPNQNFQGFHNEIKPMIFMINPNFQRIVSIRVGAGVPMQRALGDIEDTWKEIVPDYPMQSKFLDETFEDVFQIFNLTTQVLGGFALMALMLSLIGLFGLAAFMAQNRTREIGIRKVMGANIGQIIGLLIWQFSKPVLWSLLVALPLAYFSSTAYLNFFAERIGAPTLIVLGSGIVAVMFAWAIVSVHAIRIARANPIRALRYE